MKEKEEQEKSPKIENEDNNENKNEDKNEKEDKNENIINNKEVNDIFICHDKTINEVSDKKWNRYLIPYMSILKAKRKIEKDKKNNLYKEDVSINLIDINEKKCSLLSKILDEYNENNLTYHWLQVPDINNKLILVKKEHLLMQKMTNEEIEVLDYNAKNIKLYQGKYVD